MAENKGNTSATIDLEAQVTRAREIARDSINSLRKMREQISQEKAPYEQAVVNRAFFNLDNIITDLEKIGH